MKNLKSLKDLIFGNHRTVKIIVKNSEITVSRETIKRNFYFSETYRNAGKKEGISENVVYKSLREYTALLKQGKIKFFNPSLGVTYPFLTLKGGKVKYDLVVQFCKNNDIPYAEGRVKI